MKKNSVEILFVISNKNILNANALSNMHYQRKGNLVKKLRKMSFEIGSELDCQFNHFDITVVVYAPTKRRLDPHNLSPTVKPLIDGLTDAGFWEDDDWTHLRMVSFVYGGVVRECFDFEDTSNYVLKFIIKEVE